MKIMTKACVSPKQGRLTAREHVTKGFENMREAFYGLFKGENIGKAIIEV